MRSRVIPSELHNPDGSAAGACVQCRRPLTENERDPESLWFFSRHYACTFAQGDRVVVTAGDYKGWIGTVLWGECGRASVMIHSRGDGSSDFAKVFVSSQLEVF